MAERKAGIASGYWMSLETAVQRTSLEEASGLGRVDMTPPRAVRLNKKLTTDAANTWQTRNCQLDQALLFQFQVANSMQSSEKANGIVT